MSRKYLITPIMIFASNVHEDTHINLDPPNNFKLRIELSPDDLSFPSRILTAPFFFSIIPQLVQYCQPIPPPKGDISIIWMRAWRLSKQPDSYFSVCRCALGVEKNVIKVIALMMFGRHQLPILASPLESLHARKLALI